MLKADSVFTWVTVGTRDFLIFPFSVPMVVKRGVVGVGVGVAVGDGVGVGVAVGAGVGVGVGGT